MYFFEAIEFLKSVQKKVIDCSGLSFPGWRVEAKLSKRSRYFKVFLNDGKMILPQILPMKIMLFLILLGPKV